VEKFEYRETLDPERDITQSSLRRVAIELV
jgi:hypothetical protein